MDTHTTVTTAARRIARAANASAQGFVSAYDVEGRSFATWPSNMGPTSTAGERWPGAGAAVCVEGRHGRPMTQREAQDRLEAWAFEAAGQGSLGDYLGAVEFERQGEQAAR